MVEITKDRVGLLGVITVLAVYGGTVTLTLAEAENTYYCNLSNEIAVFHRLSASGKTGYYMVDGVEKGLACRSGYTYAEWISLRQYAEENGIDYEDIISNLGTVSEEDFAYVRGRQGLFKCEYDNGGIFTYSKCYKDGVFKNYAAELICRP